MSGQGCRYPGNIHNNFTLTLYECVREVLVTAGRCAKNFVSTAPWCLIVPDLTLFLSGITVTAEAGGKQTLERSGDLP